MPKCAKAAVALARGPLLASQSSVRVGTAGTAGTVEGTAETSSICACTDKWRDKGLLESVGCVGETAGFPPRHK